VYATGFTMNNLVPPFPIEGRGGVRLADAWSIQPQAYLGVVTPNFPNAFFLYGPRTNTIIGSISFFTECGVNYIVQAMRHVLRRNANVLEVREAVVREYNKDLDKRMATRPEASDCSAWYKNASGDVVQNFPGLMTEYWWLTRTFKPSDFIVAMSTSQ